MRGVVSAGMLAALEYLGLLPAFDAVYGTSAGAINGAYFIAGQAAYGATIYYEDINNSQFISYLRLLRGCPAVSLDYLFEDVIGRAKRLDWQRVLNSSIELRPVATSVRRARPVALGGFATREELFTCLKASARIPLIAGPPVAIGDDAYLDGSLYASIPFRQALEDGCTHILALLTRPLGQAPRPAGFFDRQVIARRLGRLNPELGRAVVRRPRAYADDVGWLLEQTRNPAAAPHVYAIEPRAEARAVNRTEKRHERLLEGAREGMAAAMHAFAPAASDYLEVLCPFDAIGHRVAL